MTIFSSKYPLFLGILIFSLGSPALALEVAEKPLPKLYVHRTYEYSDSATPADKYEPNLGRAGEIRIDGRDKEILSRFVQFHYKKSCAWEHHYPGKKCVAPQLTDKNFIIGYPVKSSKTAVELPKNVQKYLTALPDGYGYRLVGDDVVLMNLSDRTVIDGITLRSTYEINSSD